MACELTCPMNPINQHTPATRLMKFCEKKCVSSSIKAVFDKVCRENQRAIAEGLPGTLSLLQFLDAIDYFEEAHGLNAWVCVYCGKPSGVPSIEHWAPISSGGGTTIENCLPSCYDCNMMKGVMHGELFFAQLIQRFESPVAQRNLDIVAAYFARLASATGSSSITQRRQSDAAHHTRCAPTTAPSLTTRRLLPSSASKI